MPSVGADAIICVDNAQIGMAIAEKLDIKHVELHYCPTTCFKKDEHGEIRLNPSLPLLRDENNRFREHTLDLPPQNVDQYRDRFSRLCLIQACSKHLSPIAAEPWPDTFKMTGFIFRDEMSHWKPSLELQRFLDNGSKPPISIGFGSMTVRNRLEWAELILHALRLSGERAILLSGWGDLGAGIELPPAVMRVDHAPHGWLFSRVSAAVHHGGAGTTAAAARAGIPSIIVPFWFDQFYWGQCAAELGLGPTPIPRHELTAETLADHISATVNSASMRSKATTPAG